MTTTDAPAPSRVLGVTVTVYVFAPASPVNAALVVVTVLVTTTPVGLVILTV